MRDSLRARNIFVMLTNRCNLRCSYCYEKGKNERSASYETITRYLLKEFEEKCFDEYYIVFHGGEPFIEFDLMKTVAEWCWTSFPELNIRCMTTTNGTCLDNSMKEWLRNNRDHFVAILSLDGGRDTHNRNRCNSFDYIDKAFFSSCWPDQPVKMTVSPNTISTLFNDMIEVMSFGLKVNPSLAKEVRWDEERDLPVFKRELDKIVSYYLDNPEEMPCEMVNIHPSLFRAENPLPHNRACGAGVNNIAYNVEGTAYPCHTFIAELSKSDDPQTLSPLFEDLVGKRGDELSPFCSGCFAYPACEPCYGLNWSKRGNMGAIDSNMCAFVKARIIAASRMYAEMILTGNIVGYKALENVSDDELFDMISGIKNILSMNI